VQNEKKKKIGDKESIRNEQNPEEPFLTGPGPLKLAESPAKIRKSKKRARFKEIKTAGTKTS